ncbi:hypothetical protein [Williamsia maris]|nr:hypothetical protein [Williamsia maris]
MLWLLGGAAAIVAGATSTRSGGLGRYRAAATANGYPTITSALRTWLPGGGSERARIGNSQYVLINDPTSPKSYVFHEDVPPGGHISVNPDGTATIYDRNGQPVGTIAKPWAYDSLGRPQKTWYTVDNNGNLVQHIDPNPDAFYPILADPTEPPDLPIGMMSGSNATLSDVTGSGTATATPPPPVEQSSIADSPGIAQLPTLSEPADPPEASSLPPVEDSSIADSPGIAQLPTLSEPADPPDSSNLPPVDPSTSNDPAIEALPVLSGTGPAGSRPETIASNGLIWTQVAPDPAIFPDGLPQGQSLWTTTVNNQTITVQTLQNPDGTFTVISNGTANTYNHNGDLIKSFTPDPGQAIAGKDISIAAATLVGGLRGRAFARALSTFADVLPKSKAPLLPKPEMNFTNPSMEVNGNPSEGISEETVTKLTQALGKSLPKLGEQASNITKAIEGTPSTPSLPPPADALAPDPVTSLTMTTGFAINALIKSLRYLLR